MTSTDGVAEIIVVDLCYLESFVWIL